MYLVLIIIFYWFTDWFVIDSFLNKVYIQLINRNNESFFD